MKSWDEMSSEEIKAFFKWRIDNRWFTRTRGKWNQTFEHPTFMSDKTYEKYHRKTTEELLELFFKENNML